jgi:hypothetical protein
MLEFLRMAGKLAVESNTLPKSVVDAFLKFYTSNIFNRLQDVEDKIHKWDAVTMSYYDLKDLYKEQEWAATQLRTIEGLLKAALKEAGLKVGWGEPADELLAFKFVLSLLFSTGAPFAPSAHTGDGVSSGGVSSGDVNTPNHNPKDEDEREVRKYVDTLVNNVKLESIRKGLGFRFYLETPKEVPTKHVIDSVFQYLLKSTACSDLLNRTGLLSVTFNLHDSNSWLALNTSLTATKATTKTIWRNHWFDGLKKRNEGGYTAELALAFDLKIYSIKPPKSGFSISPLNPRLNANEKIATLDLETITMPNNELLPYAAVFKLNNTQNERIYYLTDFLRTEPDPVKASKEMLLQLCKDLLLIPKGYTIYIHNLGGFDGVFLLKPLVELLGPFKIIMDKSKDFIAFTIPGKMVFKDSYRIFPTSLASLSTLFNVPIPKGHLNHSSVNLNNLVEMREEVEAYLKKDLISLLDIMKGATSFLFSKYAIDLSTVFSASSLAMKIFRTSFLKESIPLLSTMVEKDIRSGYRGGATQLFKHSGKDLYYYDVNSLYPYAMTKPMPHHYLGKVQGKDIKLSRFFGFLNVDIYAPDSIKVPVLPFSVPDQDRISYPHGHFRGVYFSEELKYALSIGYIIKRINFGYEFSTADLFSDYVNHFYSLKAQASGGEKYLVKLLLNGLYGYFARSPDNLESKLVNDQGFQDIINKHPILDEFDINQKYTMVLYNPKIINNSLIQVDGTPVLSNVAVAAAITAYSRVIMNPFKIDPNNPCSYTDTDSIFVQFALSANKIGLALGLFKDELNGQTIKEAIFIKPKCYGYKTSLGTEKVVIAGFPRGDVPFSALNGVLNGNTFTSTSNILVKDIKTLTIKTSQITRTLTINN